MNEQADSTVAERDSRAPGRSAGRSRARLGVSAVFMIVGRSLRQHAVSTAITVGAVALACGLVMSVFTIERQTRNAFTGGPVGFDAVLGARGSKLQLVLNAVFHLETSPGNIPYELYETVRDDLRVELAIPYALGDNYRGFRIVGTTPALYEKLEYQDGRKFELARGRWFDPERMEAVIGSFVSQRTGLDVGATFSPFHGLNYNPDAEHQEKYTVVGVLEPTNSPSDRVIWIPLEGIYRMQGHVLRGAGVTYVPRPGEPIPDQHKELSAVMLKFRTPHAGVMLDNAINKRGKVATLAWPIASVMDELFEKLGWVTQVLELVAQLVLVVSAGAILAAIYNTLNERRREFAILRALGARRAVVSSAIVTESAVIAAMGALLGFGVYGAIVVTARILVRNETGVVLDVLSYHPALVYTPVAMVAVGAVVGVAPAVKAYATDVAENLTPQT